MTTKVLIADDQLLFSESLASIISSITSEIEVVAIACNGQEAIDMVGTLQPDVVLMDVHMPIVNGVDATKVIVQQHPETKILMLATFEEDEFVKKALHYGAFGYLLKDVSAHKLVTSIKAVQEGIISISPNIAINLLKQLSEKEKKLAYQEQVLAKEVEELTPREQKILSLLLEDFGNKAIAHELHISSQTTRNYVHSIYSKLGVHDRYELKTLFDRQDR